MTKRIETRAVLAGAYLKGRALTASRLTHAVEVTDGIETAVLCGRVHVDSMADPGAMDVTEIPRCGTCARKAAKLAAGRPATRTRAPKFTGMTTPEALELPAQAIVRHKSGKLYRVWRVITQPVVTSVDGDSFCGHPRPARLLVVGRRNGQPFGAYRVIDAAACTPATEGGAE